MFGLISKKKVIKAMAETLAHTQVNADYWYYINKDQKMSSFCLDESQALIELLRKLHISRSVYDEAYKIYDFKNSGKKDFVPDLDNIKRVKSMIETD